MARDTYLDHLASVPLFSACSRKDLQKIAKASDEVSLDGGRVIVEEGTTGHEAYVIVSGEAVVEKNGQEVATLGDGDHFGELALLDQGPRTATVTAKTDIQLLVLGQREFAGVMDEVPGLAHQVMGTLAARLRELDEQTYG
jgi:CRP/FNR family transcriptional regulator, cyclic AMP receptor protein